MKRILFSLLVTILLVSSSCSKNQIVINKLEGSWKLTESLTNGVSNIMLTASTFTFEDCKSDENCILKIEVTTFCLTCDYTTGGFTYPTSQMCKDEASIESIRSEYESLGYVCEDTGNIDVDYYNYTVSEKGKLLIINNGVNALELNLTFSDNNNIILEGKEGTDKIELKLTRI